MGQAAGTSRGQQDALGQSIEGAVTGIANQLAGALGGLFGGGGGGSRDALRIKGITAYHMRVMSDLSGWRASTLPTGHQRSVAAVASLPVPVQEHEAEPTETDQEHGDEPLAAAPAELSAEQAEVLQFCRGIIRSVRERFTLRGDALFQACALWLEVCDRAEQWLTGANSSTDFAVQLGRQLQQMAAQHSELWATHAAELESRRDAMQQVLETGDAQGVSSMYDVICVLDAICRRLRGDVEDAVRSAAAAAAVCVQPLPPGTAWGVATASEKDLFTWAPQTVHTLREVPFMQDGANNTSCVAALGAGSVVTGGGDGAVRQWQAAAGGGWHCVRELHAHKSMVSCIAALSSSRFVSGDTDGVLYAWALGEGGEGGDFKCLGTAHVEGGVRVRCMARLDESSAVFGCSRGKVGAVRAPGPDGAAAAQGTQGGGAADALPEWELSYATEDSKEDIEAIAVSSEGVVAAGGDDKKLYLYSTSSAQPGVLIPLAALAEHSRSIHALAWYGTDAVVSGDSSGYLHHFKRDNAGGEFDHVGRFAELRGSAKGIHADAEHGLLFAVDSYGRSKSFAQHGAEFASSASQDLDLSRVEAFCSTAAGAVLVSDGALLAMVTQAHTALQRQAAFKLESNFGSYDKLVGDAQGRILHVSRDSRSVAVYSWKPLTESWTKDCAVASPSGARIETATVLRNGSLFTLDDDGGAQTWAQGEGGTYTLAAQLAEGGRRGRRGAAAAVAVGDDTIAAVCKAHSQNVQLFARGADGTWAEGDSLQGHTDSVEALLATADGTTFYSAACDGSVLQWQRDAVRGTWSHSSVAGGQPGRGLRDVTLAAQEGGLSTTLVCASRSGAATMLTCVDGAWTGRVLTGSSQRLEHVQCVPGVGWCGGAGDKELQVWGADGERAPLSVQAMVGPSDTSDSLTAGCAAGGEFVASSKLHGVTTVLRGGESGWEHPPQQAQSQQPKQVLPVPGLPGAVLLACSGGRMQVLRRSATSGQWEQIAGTDSTGVSGQVTTLAALGEHVLMGTSAGRVAVLQVDASGVQALWQDQVHSRGVECVAAQPDGRFAVGINWEGELHVYGPSGDGQWSKLGEFESGFGRLDALAALPDGRFVTSDGNGDHPLQLWTQDGEEYAHRDLGTAAHSSIKGLYALDAGLLAVTGNGDAVAVLREGARGEQWSSVEAGFASRHDLHPLHVLSPTRIVAANGFNSFFRYERRDAQAALWHCVAELGDGPNFHRASCVVDDRTVLSIDGNGCVSQLAQGSGEAWACGPAAAGHASFESAKHWCALGADSFVTGGDEGGLVLWTRNSDPGAPWSTESIARGVDRAGRGVLAIGALEGGAFVVLDKTGAVVQWARSDTGQWGAVPLFLAKDFEQLAVLSPTRIALGGADTALHVWERAGDGGSAWGCSTQLQGVSQEVCHLLRLTEDRFVSVDADQLRTWGRGDDGAWSELGATTLPDSKPAFLHTGLDGGLVTDGGSGQVLLLAPEGDGWAITKGPEQFHSLVSAHVLSADRIITESSFNHPEVWTRNGGEWSKDSLDSADGFHRCSGLLPDGCLHSLSSNGVHSMWAPHQDGYKLQASASHDGQATCHATLAPGIIVTGAADGTVAVWRSNARGDFEQGTPLRGGAAAVAQLCAVSEASFASVDTDGALRLWAESGGQWTQAAALTPAVLARGMAFEQASSTLHVLGADGKVALWKLSNAGTWGETGAIESNITSSSPLSLAAAGGHVCVGAADGKVHLVDVQGGNTATHGDVHSDSVTAVAALPDGRFVTSSADRTVCVWRRGEAGAWQPSPALPAAPHAAATVTVLSGGIVASACKKHVFLWHELGDGLWMAREGTAQLGAAQRSLACGPDARVLCVDEKRMLQWAPQPAGAGAWGVMRLDGAAPEPAQHVAAWAGGVALTASDRGRSSTWRRGLDGAWDAAPGLPEPFLGEPRCLTAVQDAGDGVRRVVLGTKAGLAAVWCLTGDGEADIKWQLQALLPGHADAVTTALSLPEGLLLTADTSGFAQLWAPDGTGGYAVADTLREAAGDFVCGAVWEGGWAFLGMRSGTVRVLKVDDSSLQVASSLVLHGAEVQHLCMGGEGGRYLLSVDKSKNVGLSVCEGGKWTAIGSSTVPCNSIVGLAPHASRPSLVTSDGAAVVLSG